MGMGPKGFKLLSSGVGITLAASPDTNDGMMGRVQAIDVAKQELAWTFDQVTPPSTGLLATAGGLLFSGDLDPSLKAFDDATGELLWQTELDDALRHIEALEFLFDCELRGRRNGGSP